MFNVGPMEFLVLAVVGLIVLGLAWLIDAPARIRLEIPEPAVLQGPHDPLLARHEMARVQLRMAGNVLNHWQRRDCGRYLRAGGVFERGAA